MSRNRNLKGKEKCVYVDGSEVEITFYGVSSYERTGLRRMNRITEVDKQGNIKRADFKDDEFMAEVLNKSVGIQMSLEDIKELDYVLSDELDEEGNPVKKDALKYLYDKYFGDISKAKKPKSTDM